MIRERDGIHIEAGALTVVADSRSASGDVRVVSHAHGDHTPSSAGEPVVCSAATAVLVEARSGVELDHVEATDAVTLLPSGHVVGSRAALVETDRRYLYTGDVSTRDRAYLAGFEPVDADVLVVEATYGRPDYRFPPQAAVEAEITDWIRDHPTTPLVLFGYALGRAQKLQWLARRATDRRLVVYPSVAAVSAAIEAATDHSFPATSLAEVDALRPDDVLVAPASAGRSAQVRSAIERLGALTAGFSGWAVDDSYRYRTGYDESFVLTDHCDFDELVALVRAVDPETVYTHHGFAADLAHHLAGEHGYDAVALRRDQRTLREF